MELNNNNNNNIDDDISILAYEIDMLTNNINLMGDDISMMISDCNELKIKMLSDDCNELKKSMNIIREEQMLIKKKIDKLFKFYNITEVK